MRKSRKSRKSNGHVGVVQEAYSGWGWWWRWWWWTDRLWEVEGVESLNVADVDNVHGFITKRM